MADGYRTEQDSLGKMQVAEGAMWGAQTQRAVENFPISGLRFPRDFIGALGMVKYLACQVNRDLGLIDSALAAAISQAAMEVTEGQWDEQFPVDIFQTGSATSTNMNANEVIARRATEILAQGGGAGLTRKVHPNDHVNLSQSSNDVIPSCIHIAAQVAIDKDLVPALVRLRTALEAKSKEFAGVLKLGRTHLQDATPMTLGQEFSGYAAMVAHAIGRLGNAKWHLGELALGGTAIGTGINAHADFARKVIERLNDLSGMEFREAENHFEAQGARDAAVEASGALKSVAVSLYKIANDIRWLGSGPRAGLGELELPAVQPGSSIMPGKVNPVMAEALMMACAQVIGNDAAITFAGAAGNFELNTMLPLIAYDLLQSMQILTGAASAFEEKCVRGLSADEERCRETLDRSLALATALVPRLGYDAAAKLAQDAYANGKTIRDVALEKGLMKAEELDALLDPAKMIGKP
ncbi:MAG: class II fumarate hydratase [Fibrobacteres bacterium]|jgi:fumarate hydratase class II|nr:class II fumarate hydratase [Fibrobacterota bacterium]